MAMTAKTSSPALTDNANVYNYSYDGVGNRTNTALGTANSLNQYSNLSYNARGDVTDDGTFTFTWTPPTVSLRSPPMTIR